MGPLGIHTAHLILIGIGRTTATDAQRGRATSHGPLRLSIGLRRTRRQCALSQGGGFGAHRDRRSSEGIAKRHDGSISRSMMWGMGGALERSSQWGSVSGKDLRTTADVDDGESSEENLAANRRDDYLDRIDL